MKKQKAPPQKGPEGNIPQTSSSESVFALKSPPPSLHLKKILASYPEGSQLIREALQNADDAEASTFQVLLDERQMNGTASSKDALFTERFCGPALLFYNDAIFKDRDWKSLQSMFDSHKIHEMASIGKFGMGSRSYFHCTDLLSVLSNQSYGYLDPDYVLNRQGGQRWKISNAPAAHLQPFLNFHGFTKSTKTLNGTFLRLPLRLGRYARNSSFAPYEYTSPKVRSILDKFKKEVPTCLLFLRNITKVEIGVWQQAEDQPRIHFRCTVNSETEKRTLSPLCQFIKERLRTVSDISKELSCAESGTYPDMRDSIKIQTHVYPATYYMGGKDLEQTEECVTEEFLWRRRQQLCVGEDILSLVGSTELVPLVGLACLLSHTRFRLTSEGRKIVEENDFEESCRSVKGQLFAHLPIPDSQTGLPVHVQGNFCLHENRRDIWLAADDAEGAALRSSRWNRLLLFKYLPPLYVSLLCSLEDEDLCYKCFPNSSELHSHFQPLLQPFAKAVISAPVLFEGGNSAIAGRISPQDATLLKFGNVASSAMTDLTRTQMDKKLLQPMVRALLAAGAACGLRVAHAPDCVLELLQTHTEGVLTIPFLLFMQRYVIPGWHALGSKLLRQQPFLLHWMLILCLTLSRGSQSNIENFAPLCSELPFVPVENVALENDPALDDFNQQVIVTEKMLSQNEGTEKEAASRIFEKPNVSEEAIHLLPPTKCYDTGLFGFKVAKTAVPCSDFSSPSVLRVLKSWGLKQTLSWLDMAQELAMRMCNKI